MTIFMLNLVADSALIHYYVRNKAEKQYMTTAQIDRQTDPKNLEIRLTARCKIVSPLMCRRAFPQRGFS